MVATRTANVRIVARMAVTIASDATDTLGAALERATDGTARKWLREARTACKR